MEIMLGCCIKYGLSILKEGDNVGLLIRFLWFGGAIVSWLTALVGVILPILPHVPFIILGIFCLTKASPRFDLKLRTWLHGPWASRHLLPWMTKLETWPLLGPIVVKIMK